MMIHLDIRLPDRDQCDLPALTELIGMALEPLGCARVESVAVSGPEQLRMDAWEGSARI